jgi:glycosyltransferase involved in cell wall biosynthesis
VTVVEALASLPPNVELHIAGYETVGASDYVARLRTHSSELGVSSRVKFLGAIPQRADLLRACRNAHVGLALMPTRSEDLNEQAMTGASNKPFDYLACGLALLVSELPDWKEMFVTPDLARECDPQNAQSIASSLRWFVEDPRETAAMGERGRERITAEWNYETQFAPVKNALVL